MFFRLIDFVVLGRNVNKLECFKTKTKQTGWNKAACTLGFKSTHEKNYDMIWSAIVYPGKLRLTPLESLHPQQWFCNCFLRSSFPHICVQKRLHFRLGGVYKMLKNLHEWQYFAQYMFVVSNMALGSFWGDH